MARGVPTTVQMRAFRRREYERRRQSSGAEHAASATNACRATPHERGDQQRDDRDRERGGDVAVRDLDDEIGSRERWEPVTLASGPVVAAAHAGAGDADDRAEHDLSDTEDQRENRETPQRGHDIRMCQAPAATPLWLTFADGSR